MIVLASDYVGCRALEMLISKGIRITRLVLHRRNLGNFNTEMRGLHARHLASLGVPLGLDDELAEIASQAAGAHAPDLGLLAWWPDIIKSPLLALPRRGWINMHPSFLPFNRGKHPNFWCLVEGTPCGVSLHFAAQAVDAGDIIAKAELPVTWEDTGESVYTRSLELMLGLFDKTIEGVVQDKVQRIPQGRSGGTFHKASDIDEASRIDLNASYRARDLFNIIRARMFSPHPTAHFVDAGKKFSVRIIIREAEQEENG